ncbi:MAG: ammonium transporter [Capsulimonadaceae bacterium]|nr:ammonium transporter [Capsulimonadaceae bacterium]
MSTLRRALFGACALLAVSTTPAFADAASTPGRVDSGDTAWLLLCAALVFIMTPGLGFFYAGMIRSKNALSVLMQSFVACGLITLQWVAIGYSIAFGPDVHHLFGNLSWAFFKNVSASAPSPLYAPTVPHQAFAIYQLMFAIITPALISGAVVERMKFQAYVVFILLWATFVYDPLAHWVWADGGWLARMGVHDFAGGTVVEIASGVSALVMALLLGPRSKNPFGDDMRPHNLPFTLLGGCLLWFGWLAFNSGSAGSAGGSAVGAFVATQIAMSAAAVTWMAADWIMYKKPTTLGFISGAVAGGVAITPSCGYMGISGALAVGIGAGVICYLAIRIKNKIAADDSLDVFGVHGCGGMWGVLANGFFGTLGGTAAAVVLSPNPRIHQILVQALAMLAAIAFTAIGTVVVAMVTKAACRGLRTTGEDEEVGLDEADHGEAAYSPGEGAHMVGSGMAVVE